MYIVPFCSVFTDSARQPQCDHGWSFAELSDEGNQSKRVDCVKCRAERAESQLAQATQEIVGLTDTLDSYAGAVKEVLVKLKAAESQLASRASSSGQAEELCGLPCEQHDDCDRPCVRTSGHYGRHECKNHAEFGSGTDSSTAKLADERAGATAIKTDSHPDSSPAQKGE